MSDFDDFYNIEIKSQNTKCTLTLDPVNAVFKIKRGKRTYDLMRPQSKSLQAQVEDMFAEHRRTHATWIPYECDACSTVERIRYFISNFHDDIVAGRQVSHANTVVTEDALDVDGLKNWPFDDSINTYLREQAYDACVNQPDDTIFEETSFIDMMTLVDSMITQFGTEDTLRFMKLNDNALINKLIEDRDHGIGIVKPPQEPLGIDLDSWLDYLKYLHTHEWMRYLNRSGQVCAPEQDFKLMSVIIDMMNAQISLFGHVENPMPKHFIAYNETIRGIEAQMRKSLPESNLDVRTCRRLEMTTNEFLVRVNRKSKDVYRAFACMRVQPKEHPGKALYIGWSREVPRIVTFHRPDNTQRPVMLVNLLDEHTVDDAFGPYYAQPSAKQREWLDDWIREKEMKLSDNAKMLL